MAIALSSNTSMALQCLPSSRSHSLLTAHPIPTILVLPHRYFSRSTLAFSRRQNRNPAMTSSLKKNKKSVVVEEEDLDDDPFEALFSQLEEDLKNDDASNNDDDEINEEDIEMLARELEEVLGGDDIEMFDSAADDEDEDEDEDEEEERPVKLKNWQLRRLAHALKAGRRKTSIKNLAAEICLDRAIVLQLLRDPPPNLVMMSAALPDEPEPTALVPESETKRTETLPVETTVEPKTKVKEPVHVMQHRWSAQKRLKKVHVATLESVYRRSKRPTNTMISSIVHLTNLPRKRVIKWFEDKRAEDGVPDHRQPYQRSDPETVFS